MVLVLVMFTATAIAKAQPPTPFHVYGWVFNTTNQPLLNPNVTVKNLNTSEEYTVETNASYNYYQLITAASWNVNAGNELYFNASAGVNSANYTVMVTMDNMTVGGLFEQNISLYQAPPGVCGDVDGNGVVEWPDYIRLRAYVLGAPGWTIESEWAADVDCSHTVEWPDYIRLRAYVLGAPGWELNCCT